jgi:hypothetical protein
MAIREQPVAWIFTCDGCGATETQPSKTRPKYWSDLHILRDAYDYQGAAVGDGAVKLTICLGCGEAATKAINAALDQRKSAVDTSHA